MPLLVHTVHGVDHKSDWPDLAGYRWMYSLPRLAWAWEFLRRDPDYRSAYHTAVAATSVDGTNFDISALPFGLRRFEDPERDSLVANVFWRMSECREVLPLAASPTDFSATASPLKLSNLQCSTTVLSQDAEHRRDVLFTQDGRFLQIAVFGDTPLSEAVLLTPALPAPDDADSRLLAVRRLTDLVKHGWMRPFLYPHERRAERLIRVVHALDGWRAQASHRDIGISLYGEARVRRDWMDPRNHLRDQVRRAIHYGRDLMTGGYKRFLS